MMNRKHNARVRHNIVIAVGLACLILVSGGFVGTSTGDYFLKVNKGIDVFGRVYKEITANYVDEVDPEKFMQAGIDGMLGTLDPYTVYIDKEDGDEVDLLTNGKYGGIGVTIGARDGAIEVISVMDGYSAQRQGILPGDRILEVDGKAVNAKRPEEVRSLTRGEPRTDVRITIQRAGESKPISFVVVREEIQVKNVTYAAYLQRGIGYIRLERFSRRAGDEVRQAIKELKLKGDLKGMVLDLRGNPGGLLDAAVDVVSKFVPRGSLVVSTKGRRSEADRSYKSTEEPIIPEIPLVVLTDRSSASASEIVSGAIQDLDRGVIVGTRTFGKGLVQTIVPLNYGAQLKITTARYYIPSGRSIQEVDYLHKDGNGVFTIVPESLRHEFKTLKGRTVYEYGGIRPDTTVEESERSPMVRDLHRKAYFFRFVNRHVSAHKDETITSVDEEMLNAFRRYLEEEKFDFQEEAETKIGELRRLAKKSNYGADVLNELDIIQKTFETEKTRAYERNLEGIRHELEIELAARNGGEHGRIEAMLPNDDQVNTAVALLNAPALYRSTLKQ
ncbi:MAG: S41 family peptidase [Ignavibacteria bacterium]|nr:S41 family peptidase [Ignavibacteria bacterium]